MERGFIADRGRNGLLIVTTCGVSSTLSANEISEAVAQLREKMKVQDPDNPDLWTVEIGEHKLWGILDRRAGPKGENVCTILFPEEY